jgi:hypothetical protein
MIGISKHIAVAGMAVLLSAGAAQADTPPAQPVAAASAAPALDPERIELALQIIPIVMPPERVDAIVAAVTDAIAKPLKGQLAPFTAEDPGLAKLMDDFMHDILQVSRTTMVASMPAMRIAMARAYARNFTREELAQILAFGQTPAGGKYLSRAADLLQDPDVQAYYAQLMPMVQKDMAPALETFKRKVQDYFKAHPDVAKKINKPA